MNTFAPSHRFKISLPHNGKIQTRLKMCRLLSDQALARKAKSAGTQEGSAARPSPSIPSVRMLSAGGIPGQKRQYKQRQSRGKQMIR